MATGSSSSSSSSLTVAKLTKAQRCKLQGLSSHYEIYSTLGTLNLIATVIVAVRFTDYYWLWHMAQTSFYLPVRFWRFSKIKLELYLLDWCYHVTYISTICSILAFVRVTFGIGTFLEDYNTQLIRAGFAMACGPLAWSIFIFRNSIVFYDVDRSTSVFIHLSPCILFWCLRWGTGQHGPSSHISSSGVEDGMFKICESQQDYDMVDRCMESWTGMMWCNACTVPLLDFIVPPALLYLGVWSIPYFMLVFVWCTDWIQQTQRETLYVYFTQVQPGLNAIFENNLKGVFGPRLAGPVGYMMMHFVSIIVFSTGSYVLWHSFLLHTLFLVALFCKGIHNGSTYMFRVFAYRFAQEQLDMYRDLLE